MIKVVGAFVAGVVVALGSALIYVRVSDLVHPHPVSQAMLPAQPLTITDTALPVAAHDPSPQEADPPPETSQASQTQASQTSEPVRKVSSKKHKPAAPPNIVSIPSKIDTSKYEPNHDPIEIAQNQIPQNQAAANLPSANLPTSAPPPAVNDAPPAADPEPPVMQQEAQASAAPVRQPNVVTLPAGTNLAVRLGETLSTEHNYTGDTFRGTLESPIIMDGFIIADRGSKVLGKIINAEKAGRMEGVSGLTLALTEINTTDGQRVKIETNSFIRRGSSNTGEDAAKIAGGAALGAIIGAMAGGGKGAAIGAGAGGAAGTGAVLLTHGKPAVLPTETRMSFRLANPVTITERLNN